MRKKIGSSFSWAADNNAGNNVVCYRQCSPDFKFPVRTALAFYGGLEH